jgi:hypothetical protein
MEYWSIGPHPSPQYSITPIFLMLLLKFSRSLPRKNPSLATSVPLRCR